MDTHKNNITKTASANLAKGSVVKLSTADKTKVEACSANDANAIGIVLDNVNAGDNVAIALLGIANHTVEVVANGAIGAGEKVCLGANGKVSAFPEAGAQAQNVVCIGIALTNAYADENVVEIAHRAPTVEVVAQA